MTQARVEFEKLVYEIRAWWNERIVDGKQLEFIGDYLEGQDYRGKGDWKRYISVWALKADYERSRGIEVSPSQWCKAFPRASGMDAKGDAYLRRVRMEIDGMKSIRHIRFYRFEKRPLTVMPL